jgi:chorismate-pyruvate lyase
MMSVHSVMSVHGVTGLHRVASVAVLGLLSPLSLSAQSPPGSPATAPMVAPPWPDSFVTRLEALALLQTLNAELLSHDSATVTLERWCSLHRLASPPRIVAERIAGAQLPPSMQQRQELGVTPTQPVRYRRVRLLCGSMVLSEAENWYVPDRLTAEMNQLLDDSDMPFGRVVQALHFQRHTLSSALLWRPLPAGWEMSASMQHEPAAALSIPPGVLQQRSVLSLPDGTPFSEVVETYTANVLAFSVPRAAAPVDGAAAPADGGSLQPFQ